MDLQPADWNIPAQEPRPKAKVREEECFSLRVANPLPTVASIQQYYYVIVKYMNELFPYLKIFVKTLHATFSNGKKQKKI